VRRVPDRSLGRVPNNAISLLGRFIALTAASAPALPRTGRSGNEDHSKGDASELHPPLDVLVGGPALLWV